MEFNLLNICFFVLFYSRYVTLVTCMHRTSGYKIIHVICSKNLISTMIDAHAQTSKLVLLTKAKQFWLASQDIPAIIAGKSYF